MALPSAYEISAQVETICRNEPLSRSKRGREVLRYISKAALAGATNEDLKEVVIGADVFRLPYNYDPRENSIVRVTIISLREKLDRYYETLGRGDPIRIKIPVGGYLPEIYYVESVAALKLSDHAAMCVANAKVALDKRTLPGFAKAFHFLDAALQDHPNHPRLLSLKAMAHAGRANYGGDPRIEFRAAQALIDTVQNSGNEAWERYLVEAWLAMAIDFDWTAAATLFERAIELSHGEAQYKTWYTAYLFSQLRMEEGLELVEASVAHSATDQAYLRIDLAFCQLVASKFNEAEETLRVTFELFPNSHYLQYLHLALLHEARGDFAKAADVIQRVPVTMQDTTIALGLRPLMIGLAGQLDLAKRLYEEMQLIRRSGHTYIPASQLANAALGAREWDEAGEWYTEAALVEHDPMMSWLAILPFSRHIHQRPNFRSLVIDKMKLRFPDVKRAASVH